MLWDEEKAMYMADPFYKGKWHVAVGRLLGISNSQLHRAMAHLYLASLPFNAGAARANHPEARLAYCSSSAH